MILNARRAILALSGLLCLALSACNAAPKAPPTMSVADAAETLVALTFAAATQSAANSSPTPLPQATPTTGRPLLYVNGNVGCRTGAGQNFSVVTTFPPGTVLEMVGKDTAEGAWLVKVPNTSTTCWVRAQDSTPSGSFMDLPEATPQPSAQQLPHAPVDLSWPYVCAYKQGVLYTVTTTLSWSATAGEVNGFRVYRGDTPIADLPASVTTLADTTDVTIGADLTYSVEAYNDAGVSPRLSHTITSICKSK